MIIGNTAYNNPPNSTTYSVSSNYSFVTNVFNPLFGQAPTALQNISLAENEPILAPINVALLTQQILYQVSDVIPSQLDAIAFALSSQIGQVEETLFLK